MYGVEFKWKFGIMNNLYQWKETFVDLLFLLNSNLSEKGTEPPWLMFINSIFPWLKRYACTSSLLEEVPFTTLTKTAKLIYIALEKRLKWNFCEYVIPNL